MVTCLVHFSVIPELLAFRQYFADLPDYLFQTFPSFFSKFYGCRELNFRAPYNMHENGGNGLESVECNCFTLYYIFKSYMSY